MLVDAPTRAPIRTTEVQVLRKLHYSKTQYLEWHPDVMSKVTAKFPLPFEPFDYQCEAVQTFCETDRAGLYADPGTGKTMMSTVIALYHLMQERSKQVIVIMPPILLISWKRWLDAIPGVTSEIYAGSPAKRKLMKLDSMFVLMSMDIFKNDYTRLSEHWFGVPVTVVVDEAASIKNVSSKSHKLVRDFVEVGQQRALLLTGTPLSTPMDAYAYCKFTNPKAYLTKRVFEAHHVRDYDFFNKPTGWLDLDTLQDNFLYNSCRALKEELLGDLPPITFSPIHYALDSAHQKLYKRIADEQLLELENGGKIDATTPNKLYVKLQQVIMNYGYFANNPELKPAGLDVVLEALSELGEGKLIIFAYYKMTIASLKEYLKEFGAVALNGDEPANRRQANIDRFINDPTCRVLIAQPKSGGVGLNLQENCSNVLFIELPLTPGDFTQAISRVYRQGQLNPVTIRVAVALRTLQVKVHNRLLAKDQLVNRVSLSVKDLRDSLYGD